MIIFAGTFFNFKLDSKGRLSIPTKWRERLGRDFYMVAVTVKGCKCITLYPVSEFEKVYEKTQHGTENQMYDTSKELLSKTEECAMDSQGRFTLNQRLKEMSLLSNDSEVILEGNGGSIEIWNTQEYEKMHNTFDPNVGVYDLMDRANGDKSDDNSSDGKEE